MTYPIASDEAYYVVARDGQRLARLSGPYLSHGEAAKHVDDDRREVARRYPNDAVAHFADYWCRPRAHGDPMTTAVATCSRRCCWTRPHAEADHETCRLAACHVCTGCAHSHHDACRRFVRCPDTGETNDCRCCGAQ